ncbi:hypothetical protein NAPIS_ORF02766 [Vairimorpha apis BRL 01]|uniref:Uncharacterized protein n=1 Tax=Vairimorpha apis BRL 01 TaxID=1037528 RepID=T0MF08_9MICR|nr:hypothetical protein NAPIS_ORF02766 [Vairimorpha apis BRL 01]
MNFINNLILGKNTPKKSQKSTFPSSTKPRPEPKPKPEPNHKPRHNSKLNTGSDEQYWLNILINPKLDLTNTN